MIHLAKKKLSAIQTYTKRRVYTTDTTFSLSFTNSHTSKNMSDTKIELTHITIDRISIPKPQYQTFLPTLYLNNRIKMKITFNGIINIFQCSLFFLFFLKKYSHQHLHSSLRSQLQAIGKFTDPEITFTKSYLFTGLLFAYR